MHTIKLNIHNSVFDKVIYFLENLPPNEVEIIEEESTKNDWSHLEAEIDKGLTSGVSRKSHKEITSDIKSRYA